MWCTSEEVNYLFRNGGQSTAEEGFDGGCGTRSGHARGDEAGGGAASGLFVRLVLDARQQLHRPSSEQAAPIDVCGYILTAQKEIQRQFLRWPIPTRSCMCSSTWPGPFRWRSPDIPRYSLYTSECGTRYRANGLRTSEPVARRFIVNGDDRPCDLAAAAPRSRRCGFGSYARYLE